MKKFSIFLFALFLLKQVIMENPCTPIDIKPYESNPIYIKKNTTKCVCFPFDNPSEGNIVLKLLRSNSFTSMIYIFEKEEDIDYDSAKKDFPNASFKYHIGEDFFKEKKLENMKKQTYYFIIYESDFYFNDQLIIYNDKFEQNNYFEIKEIVPNQRSEFNFKYEYSNDNPIIIHFKSPANNIKYLNYQFSNKKEDGKSSFYIYKTNLDGDNLVSSEDTKENSGYLKLEKEIDYYIKITTDGEIDFIFEFLEEKVMKITPDDIFQRELITLNELYFYIEKELVYENDEYFNEFTIKLDSTNLGYLPFEIAANTCDDNSEESLLKCLEGDPKPIIKRDMDIPYIYHIYYSFSGKNYLSIKITNKKSLEKKQRIIIEASGGNDLVDNKHEKVFTDNKGYLYPVYLNISIADINNKTNNNKNRILFIYTNTTSAIKIFYNEDTFKNDNIDIKEEEYFTIDHYVYGFDFNKENVKKLFGDRTFFTIMIYCPWESTPISFQLSFINDNINNFNYIIDEKRPTKSPVKIQLSSPNEKYYLVGQYDEIAQYILFNEVIYGKIEARYKFFNENDKISHLIYNESARGYYFSSWTPIYRRIDIVEITCISPALVYMHFIEDKAIQINSLMIEKDSENYIFLNNSNYYNLGLSPELKESKNINIEVFLVSQRNNQSIEILINGKSFTLNITENNTLLRHTVESLESLAIQGHDKATAFRIKVTGGLEEKNLAFYMEYPKNKEDNKISKKININIANNNSKTGKLCYTMSFVDSKYLHVPREENCFELNANEKTTLTMYNPWEKYLINRNKLYTESDSFYISIYVEDNSLKNNFEFKSEEEFLEIDSELKKNELINIHKNQKNLIKSSQTLNQMVLIQFSPIYNDNNDTKKVDKYIIKSQLDEIIQEGEIYSKNNRTFVSFTDQMIDCFLELEIESNNQYEVKYNTISNKNNFNEEKINNNYTIELIDLNKNTPCVQFNPLIKGKDVNYSIYLTFDNDTHLSSITNLKKLNDDGNTTYIFSESRKTNDDLVQININSELLNRLKTQKWKLNVLSEENKVYNITMIYNMIEGPTSEGKEEQKKEEEDDDGGSNAGMIFLWIFIVLLVAGGGAFAVYYFFYKKRNNKIDSLLDDINNVNLSMEDQTEKGLNTEEGIIK